MKKTAVRARHFTHAFLRLFHVAILEHVRPMGVILLAAGLGGALWLVVQLLLLQPAGQELTSAPVEKRLSVETIDRLEFWIEEVDAERNSGFPAPPRPLFVIEDLPAEL